VYSADSAEESEQERSRKGVLGKLACRRFESMLRAQTGRRGDVARAMVFCLDHADAASQVADIIVASLLVDGTAVPRKVSRLHLICDILHNSAASVRNAWKFRQEFQTRLPIVFDHLSTIYHSFPGRITAETFKKQIIAVVEVWEDWIVFPADFTSELRVRLDGGGNEVAQSRSIVEEEPTQHEAPVDFSARFKTSSFRPAAEGENGDDEKNHSGDDDLDGEVMDDIDGEPVDLDAEAVDGEPLPDDGGTAGEPADLDGTPMVD